MCSLEKKMQKWLGWRNLLQNTLMKNLIFEPVQLNGVCEETLFVSLESCDLFLRPGISGHGKDFSFLLHCQFLYIKEYFQ